MCLIYNITAFCLVADTVCLLSSSFIDENFLLHLNYENLRSILMRVFSIRNYCKRYNEFHFSTAGI